MRIHALKSPNMLSPNDVASDIYRRAQQSITSSWKVNQVSGGSNKVTVSHFGHDAARILNSLAVPCNRPDDWWPSTLLWYPCIFFHFLSCTCHANLFLLCNLFCLLFVRCSYSGFIAAAVCVMQLHSLLPSKRNVQWTHCHRPRQTETK